MNKIKKYQKYCTGCGLCHSEHNIDFYLDEVGYLTPKLNSDYVDSFCKGVCPFSSAIKNRDYSIWGPMISAYGGFSNDDSIRFKSSSGGILSEIAIYLLKNKIVDGVIQTKVDKENPINTVTVCSTIKEEVLDCMGSRYTTSSTLLNLSNMIAIGKTYAVIGKPCEITSLKNYMNITGKYKNEIKYTLSFFCAGTPSKKANQKLLEELNCPIDECVSLQYRGNGWPGYTTAIDKKSNIYKMEYQKSWGDFLGRDIRNICKFCIDGTGEVADIACGDYWYLDKSEKPEFSEHEGRSLIFARTEIGDRLLHDMKKNNVITLFEFGSTDKCREYQPHQFQRKTTLVDKYIVSKICFRTVPKYSFKKLILLGRHNSINNHLKMLKGTIKRILIGRI